MTIQRRTLYALAPVASATEGAAALAAEIVNRHGRGRWWSTGPAALYVGQVEGVARIAEIEGVPHVVLAAYYFWAPPVALPTCASAPETLPEAWRRFDREYPAGEINVGDRVRWWPHVTALGTPAADASYSDGVIVERDVIRIESHGPNRWSSRDGLVGDLRSCAAALVRRLPVPVITTCPGYNGVFHVDPDPPDVAERQAARVLERQREELARHLAKPVEPVNADDYAFARPPAAAIPDSPAERGRPIPGIDTRPDGFDQGRIDALKAAMLAPAPKAVRR